MILASCKYCFVQMKLRDQCSTFDSQPERDHVFCGCGHINSSALIMCPRSRQRQSQSQCMPQSRSASREYPSRYSLTRVHLTRQAINSVL